MSKNSLFRVYNLIIISQNIAKSRKAFILWASRDLFRYSSSIVPGGFDVMS